MQLFVGLYDEHHEGNSKSICSDVNPQIWKSLRYINGDEM